MPEPAIPGKDRLDLLIDSAIATYAEPPAGLEDRILGACVASRFQSPAKPQAFPVRRLIPGFVALAAAACLLVALLVRHHPASPPLQALNPATPQVQTRPIPPTILAIRHHHRPASRPRPQQSPAAAKAVPAPKLDVFPTPEPLTPQERALVTFAGQAPEIERRAISQPSQQTEAPLNIAAIYIPLLTPPDKDQ